MFLYNLIIYTYVLGIRLASLFIPKGRLWVEGRRNWQQKLKSNIQPGKPLLWFHCASLGEFEDGRVLMEMIREQYPQYFILISFSSPSGYEKQKQCAFANYVCYLPPDTLTNANAFVELISPKLAVIFTNDIWVNYIETLHSKKIPAFHIGMCMAADSSFLKRPLKQVYRNAFARFTAMYVQNTETEKLIKNNMLLPNIIVTGDPRADRTMQISKTSADIPGIAEFIRTRYDLCFIGGSLLPKDEELFLQAIQKFTKLSEFKAIIVPHEIDEKHIAHMIAQQPDRMIAYSNIVALKRSHNILWIDNVGMLSRLYKYTHVAFIGGGFNRIGIHNIQEPASFGNMVAFGPNQRGYKEATDMLANGGAVIVHNAQELENLIANCYQGPLRLNDIKASNLDYIQSTAGASARTLELLKPYLA